MAVTLKTPTNRVVPRNGTTRFSWTSSYPQSAYEVQYRPVGSTAWNTFGVVTSTSQTADVDVSSLIDFHEYHFRVVLYANTKSSGNIIYDGNEKSPVYSIIVSPPGQIAKLRAKYGDKILEVSIYSDTNSDENVKVCLEKGGKCGTMPVISPEETTSTSLHLKYPTGIRAFGDASAPNFTYSNIPAETYMRVDSQNTHYRYYYRYAYGTYYLGNYLSSYSTKYSTQNLGNYLTGYTAKYDKTYYRGYYLSSSVTKYDNTYSRGYYLVSSDSGYYRYRYYYSYHTGYYTMVHYRCHSQAYWKDVYNDGSFYTYEAYDKYWCNALYDNVPTWDDDWDFKYDFYQNNVYAQYYGYYAYTANTYARYYGYYRYTTSNYAPYYGYYKYYSPNYSPYYSYYRFTTSYKQTYYSYSRAYRYA